MTIESWHNAPSSGAPGNHIVKEKNEIVFCAFREKGNLLLYDLLLPCIFDLFDVVCYLMHAFAHLVAVGVNEIRNSVQASDIPAVFVNKRGKLTVKFSEIVFVLPLCFWSGFLLVGNTAPCKQGSGVKGTCGVYYQCGLVCKRWLLRSLQYEECRAKFFHSKHRRRWYIPNIPKAFFIDFCRFFVCVNMRFEKLRKKKK